jgi:hypothetical protein
VINDNEERDRLSRTTGWSFQTATPDEAMDYSSMTIVRVFMVRLYHLKRYFLPNPVSTCKLKGLSSRFACHFARKSKVAKYSLQIDI